MSNSDLHFKIWDPHESPESANSCRYSVAFFTVRWLLSLQSSVTIDSWSLNWKSAFIFLLLEEHLEVLLSKVITDMAQELQWDFLVGEFWQLKDFSFLPSTGCGVWGEELNARALLFCLLLSLSFLALRNFKLCGCFLVKQQDASVQWIEISGIYCANSEEAGGNFLTIPSFSPQIH